MAMRLFRNDKLDIFDVKTCSKEDAINKPKHVYCDDIDKNT